MKNVIIEQEVLPSPKHYNSRRIYGYWLIYDILRCPLKTVDKIYVLTTVQNNKVDKMYAKIRFRR
jgi:hypothetical protein